MVNNIEEKTVDNGNTLLGLSVGTGAWGGMTYLVAGHFCPVCLVLTPLLFAGGMLKKIRFMKQKSVSRRSAKLLHVKQDGNTS